MTALFGLIGKTLNHSHSPAFFNEKFKNEGIDAEYRLFPLKKESDLKQLLRQNPQIRGLNVTVPYKKTILTLVDRQDEVVRKTGASNTLEIVDGLIIAHNTDTIGFEYSLRSLPHKHIKQALILGTGGAAMAVAFVLRQMGINYSLVSRTISCLAIPYGMIDKHLMKNTQLIVNATPVGMYPNSEEIPPIPYRLINGQHTVIDLIYNPPESALLREAKKLGAHTLNGSLMLKQQALAAWEYWKHLL